MKITNKAQLNNSTVLAGATAFAVGLLVLIIVIYAGTSVINSVHDSNIAEQQTTITNETVTISAAAGGVGFNGSFTVVGARKGLVNSTVSVHDAVGTLVHGTDYIGTDLVTGTYNVITNYTDNTLNITYDFLSDVEDTATNVTQNGMVAMFNFSGQAGNLGTIAAIVLVITILVGGLAIASGKGSFR